MGGGSLGPGYMDTYGWVPFLSTWNSEYCLSAMLQYKIKLFLIKYRLWGCRRRTSTLQRKQGAGVRRKETGSEGNYGHTCSFLNNYIEVWLIFSVALSSAAQQCDSVIHIKNVYFLILFHGTYRWILNIVSYALHKGFVVFHSPVSQLPLLASPTPFLMANSYLDPA